MREILFATPGSIFSLLGTSNAKVVFTKKQGNSRWIFFLDFNDMLPEATMLQKPAGKQDLNADSPLLSPDGRFVAYFLIQGNDENGAYIQELRKDAEAVIVDANGTEPHWWRDSSGVWYIVYSNKFLVNKGQLAQAEGKTFRRTVTISGSSVSLGAAEELAPHPMNGGLSADGRYLCTGYADAAFYDLQNDNLIPINSGLNVCNPSITPDTLSTDRMLFLNFQGIQNMLGTYASDADYPADTSGRLPQHSVIFFVNKTNTVVDFVPVLPHYMQWQDPEWSNKSGFICALGGISDASADGVIVRLSDKTVLSFTPGSYKLDITSTPSLWIGN